MEEERGLALFLEAGHFPGRPSSRRLSFLASLHCQFRCLSRVPRRRPAVSLSRLVPRLPQYQRSRSSFACPVSIPSFK